MGSTVQFVLFNSLMLKGRGPYLILSLEVVPTRRKAKFDGDKMNMLKVRTKYYVVETVIFNVIFRITFRYELMFCKFLRGIGFW